MSSLDLNEFELWSNCSRKITVWGKMKKGVGKKCKMMWGKKVWGVGFLKNKKVWGSKKKSVGFFSKGVGEQKKKWGVLKWCGEKMKDGVGKIEKRGGENRKNGVGKIEKRCGEK